MGWPRGLFTGTTTLCPMLSSALTECLPSPVPGTPLSACGTCRRKTLFSTTCACYVCLCVCEIEFVHVCGTVFFPHIVCSMFVVYAHETAVFVH